MLRKVYTKPHTHLLMMMVYQKKTRENVNRLQYDYDFYFIFQKFNFVHSLNKQTSIIGVNDDDAWNFTVFDMVHILLFLLLSRLYQTADDPEKKFDSKRVCRCVHFTHFPHYFLSPVCQPFFSIILPIYFYRFHFISLWLIEHTQGVFLKHRKLW